MSDEFKPLLTARLDTLIDLLRDGRQLDREERKAIVEELQKTRDAVLENRRITSEAINEGMQLARHDVREAITSLGLARAARPSETAAAAGGEAETEKIPPIGKRGIFLAWPLAWKIAIAVWALAAPFIGGIVHHYLHTPVPVLEKPASPVVP